MRVFRTLCDAARGRRLATTPGGAGLVPAGVRSARSLPPDASAEQGNRPTPRVHARLPTWWFDFLEGEGGGRPSHEVRKTRLCFALRIPCRLPSPRADADTKDRLQRDVIAAKWLLWNGRKERCFEELEALRRETGWAGSHNPLGRLIRYLRGCSALLVNYARRRALRLPISSAGAESVVDYLIGQRMKRNGHMRWTREGANSLLQVRCAVLNGQDVRNFKRWYPPGKPFAPLPRAHLVT